jgi:C1A family cysteine protease
MSTWGQMYSEDYAYTATDMDCAYNSAKPVIKTRSGTLSYTKVQPTNEDMMAAAAETPLAVALNASSYDFRNYSTGVLTSWTCSTDVNHGVVIVGYNNDNGDEPYWLVRNSWGTGFGENGYIKIGMASGSKGLCGINQFVAWASLDNFTA